MADGLAAGAQRWMVVGSIAAALGVVAGAFGAHGLREQFGPEALAVWETAARYHLIHALGLFAVAFVAQVQPSRLATVAGWLLTGGIVVFAGTLYLLAASSMRWLGAITPIGGVAFIAGWACLAVAAARRARDVRTEVQ